MHQKNTILIVDDERLGRATLEALLRHPHYQLLFASNGSEALEQAHIVPPDLILLDVMMPDIDGFEVCRRIRSDTLLSEVPIIMVTGLDDRESRIQGIESGADDFISKPFDHTELQARVRTITRLNRYRRLLEERNKFERVVSLSPDGLMVISSTGEILLANPAVIRLLYGEEEEETPLVGNTIRVFVPEEHVDHCLARLNAIGTGKIAMVRFETEMMRSDGTRFSAEITSGHIVWDATPAAQVNVRDVTERKRAEKEIRRSKNELALAYDATLVGWVKALDLRDRETEGHSQRVAEMCVRLAQAVGYEGEDIETIRRGALLHDIGKMGIPDHILFKPGPLTDEEWSLMRKHPEYAYEWLAPIEYLRPSLDIPYSHHEKWDGTGYPRGLKGEDIPLPARIFAIVDVWDALRSKRPYREVWPEEKVCNYIRSLSGKQFDPMVVEVFLANYHNLTNVSF
jgi:PAS domain S-box-containing protein/putative nucleotidyltransferase with HDIG domain